MEEIKKLGVWMCHSSIHLVEYTNQFAIDLQKNQSEESHTIETDNETSQNEAYHLQTESFKKLGAAIENYQDVILFGPKDVKVEFMNFLNADARFTKINIEVAQTDNMCEEQQQKFVENHFTKKSINALIIVE
jgi:stalled ribosome rescue protein Dom34